MNEMAMHSRKFSSLLIAVACSAFTQAARAQENFADLDLAALMQMDVKVTTVSKSEQSIYSVAAPIHVVTAEDIRRAGASSIPEAIRLAPGVVVAQIDPGKWIVGLRGFAWQYANKALILLDGRAVYSPLNSSVYWNSLDMPMGEIERIEVIRGPGDARWGSHAVNGIINIITKAAADSQGSELAAALDSNAGRTLTARNGGRIGSNVNYRAYANYFEQGDFAMAPARERLGDRSAVRAGLRLDGTSASGDRFTLIGELQNGRDTSTLDGQSFAPVRYDANEWSALGRWERARSAGVDQQLQLSFDRISQPFYEERDTLDFSYQARIEASAVQTLTFGVTYKHSSDALSAAIAIEPARMTQETYGLFAHDSIALGARTRLLLGSQFEHNRFTGWEIQPNAQLIHTRERQSYWASVSRAVRTPLRTENGFALEFLIAPGVFARTQGNPQLESEEILAWEIGARWGVSDALFLDASAFYNQYDNLILQQAGAPIFEPDPAPGRTVFPAIYTNTASGHTSGVELALKAQPMASWSLSGSISLFRQTPWQDSLGHGLVTGIGHQFQAHSSAQIVRSLQWNADLYYTGAVTTGDVPAYWKFDTQLAWFPTSEVQVAIGVRNAFSAEHREAGANSVDAVTMIPRTAYLRILRRF